MFHFLFVTEIIFFFCFYIIAQRQSQDRGYILTVNIFIVVARSLIVLSLDQNNGRKECNLSVTDRILYFYLILLFMYLIPSKLILIHV